MLRLAREIGQKMAKQKKPDPWLMMRQAR